jgi:hypothetical protein
VSELSEDWNGVSNDDWVSDEELDSNPEASVVRNSKPCRYGLWWYTYCSLPYAVPIHLSPWDTSPHSPSCPYLVVSNVLHFIYNDLSFLWHHCTDWGMYLLNDGIFFLMICFISLCSHFASSGILMIACRIFHPCLPSLSLNINGCVCSYINFNTYWSL